MINRNTRFHRRVRDSWFRQQLSIRPLPVWVLVALDVLLIGISLVVFALFHHVIPHSEESTGIVSTRPGAAYTEEVSETPMPLDVEAADESTSEDETVEAEPLALNPADAEAVEAGQIAEAVTPEPTQAAPVGYFGNKFPDKFSDGEITKTNNSYKSANVNITINRYEYDESTFYYADIYIKDISCFQTAFAQNRFAQGIVETPEEMNHRAGGVLAMNGDYYGTRKDGVVIRNGELYRNKHVSLDVCVLYWDGTMETYSRKEFNAKEAMEKGAYQAWNFGPRLLDEEGQPMKRFSNASIGPRNPRTVLGYFEPGHYCFVVVDGRSNSSSGLTIKVLAKLMSQLGCVRAYNMDGGSTSMMLIGDKVISKPAGGGRSSSDIILIKDIT